LPSNSAIVSADPLVCLYIKAILFINIKKF
jgi:hypothetical protein